MNTLTQSITLAIAGISIGIAATLAASFSTLITHSSDAVEATAAVIDQQTTSAATIAQTLDGNTGDLVTNGYLDAQALTLAANAGAKLADLSATAIPAAVFERPAVGLECDYFVCNGDKTTVYLAADGQPLEKLNEAN